jgi:hypothetical protein
MRRLEIIHLRSCGEPLESLSGLIRDSIKADGNSTEVVTLYRRDRLKTDVAVHIHYLEVPGREGTSALGFRLASALRDLGLVEHTGWVEPTETGNE